MLISMNQIKSRLSIIQLLRHIRHLVSSIALAVVGMNMTRWIMRAIRTKRIVALRTMLMKLCKAISMISTGR